MSVISITAKIACDGCGARFDADLDTGYKLPNGWTLWDYAQDVVRGGISLLNGTSVQGEHMLCHTCTQHVDEHTDDNPTREQVATALASKD